MSKLTTLWALMLIMLPGSICHAQATAPLTQTLQGTVTQLTGSAQIRNSENDPWQLVRVGMAVKEGAELRTNVRSRVVVSIPPDQSIILDRLGTIKLLLSRQNPAGLQTTLAMPYGRTQYQVEEAGLRHDARITSPGAVLAVRGTRSMTLYDQTPFVPVAVASQPVEFRNQNGQTLTVGHTRADTHIAADKTSAGEQYVQENRLDPAGGLASRSDSEIALLDSFSSAGPDLGIQSSLNSEMNAANFKAGLIGVLPIVGQLDFMLFWTTPGFSDLDLSVTSPRGKTVSARHPQLKFSGQHFGDEASINGFGEEQILWGNGFPRGRYTITVKLKDSTADSSAQVVIIKNPLTTAKQLALFSATINPQNPTFTKIINVRSSGPRQR